MNRGTLYALASYFLWGLLPVYWKALHDLPALETTAHRVVWSAVFAAIVLSATRNWGWLAPALRNRRIVWTFLGAAALILVNWLIYIIAVNNNQIVESSLGYFMNPLVNVLLAVVFLRERPRPWQWFAIAIAATGVAYLTISYGRLPWVALGLAFSFGFYGLLKKTATIGAQQGLFLEMIILTIPMAIYLIYLEVAGTAHFGHAGSFITTMLVMAGVVTAVPLMLFAAGARSVPLTVLGLFQYMAPTMQFVLGVALYHEPFTVQQLVGFGFIWVALAFLTVEGILERRRLLALRPH